MGGLLAAFFLSLAISFTMLKTVTIIVDQDIHRITTWRTHVESALAGANIILMEGDVVEPDPGQKLVRGMEIRVKRSFPVHIMVDGQEHQARSVGETAAELLAREGVSLGPLDRVEPDIDHVVTAGELVRVIRVTQEQVVMEEEIPHGSKQWAEPTLEKGKTKIVGQGQRVEAQDFRSYYEDGTEVDRRWWTP